MANFFYFDQHNQKLGPVTEEQLKELAAQGAITAQTPMETDTGHKGVAGQIPGMTFGTAAPNPSAQPAPATAPMQLSGNLPTAHNLNNYFKKYAASAITLTLVGSFMNLHPALLVLTIVCFFTWAVCWCLLIYNLWKFVPAGIARTTPGKAVGFSMIPLYNSYWIFVSVLGLCKDLNTTLRQQGIRHRVNEGLGMMYCILFVASFICVICDLEMEGSLMFLVFLVDVVGVVIGIILFKYLVDGGTALLEQRRVEN